MAFDFSDEFFPTALSAGLSASTSDNVVQVDTLPSAFVTEVQNTDSPEFPLRIGRGQSQERVLVIGINDASTGKLNVSRNEGPYGLSSHAAGARVAHAMPAGTATRISVIGDALRIQEGGDTVEHLYLPEDGKMWTDSAQTTPVDTSALPQPLGALEDQSGNHVATQGTTANKPTVKEDVQGRLYIEMLPGEDFLETTLTTPTATKVSTIPGVGAFSAEVDPSLKGRANVRLQSTTAGALVRGGTYSQDARGDWASALDQRGKDVADAVTSFKEYFRDEPLTHYDAHAQDTSSVTNMGYMFQGTSVSDLSPLSGWDTSSVTAMGSMFNGTSVSDLSPLSGWDTSSVTAMGSMFRGTSLSDLSPLRNWDTSSVTNMGGMFAGTSVSDLSPLSGWDTSSVTIMVVMFLRTSVSDLSPLSNWDTSQVTNMRFMFQNTSVSDLSGLSGWDTSNVTNMGHMFDGTSVSDLSPLSGWDTSNVTDMGNMFDGTSVSDLSPLSGWDTSNVTDMGNMFDGTSVSDPSTISGWDVANVNNFASFLEDAPLDSAKTGDMLDGWTDGSPNTAADLQTGVTLGIQNADFSQMDTGGQDAVNALCSNQNWTINATNAPADCS